MEIPDVIKKCGFEFSWKEDKVWNLDIPIESIPIEQLIWHFEIPFWFKPEGHYDLTPNEVINSQEKFQNEYKRILDSDTSYPLDIMLWKGKWLLLDGLHRLAKLYIEGIKQVKVRKIPHRYIPFILSKPLENGQSWINRKAEIKTSSLGGKGLFAKDDFIAGEVVVIWNGEFTDSEGAQKALKENRLVMQWDENLYSVENRGDDDGYFINHSCDSNLWMEDAYTLITRLPIKAGEEITADYVLWEADENYVSKWTCNCGSKYCRKKITGKDWRNKDLQERYKYHFSPLLNKRIKEA